MVLWYAKRRAGYARQEIRNRVARATLVADPVVVELLLLRAFYGVPSARLATTSGAPRPRPLPVAAPWRCSSSCSARLVLSSSVASDTLASRLRSAIRRTRAQI